jgi:hypothetical protein
MAYQKSLKSTPAKAAFFSTVQTLPKANSKLPAKTIKPRVQPWVSLKLSTSIKMQEQTHLKEN